MNPVELWAPSTEQREASQMSHFLRDASRAAGRAFDSYDDLHAWSVERYPEFWKFLLQWSGIVLEGELEPEVVEPRMPGAKFFPNVRLNFAENLLRFDDDATALVSISESRPTVRWTYAELRRDVARLQTTFRELGLQPGERVAGFVPNCAEAVIAMLAATSLGAAWSSCSPDFGVQGVLDRFGQIEPRFIFSADAYVYNGKNFHCLSKTAEIAAKLPTVERVIVFPFAGSDSILPEGLSDRASLWSDFLSADPQPLEFQRFPFNHPLYVMFSSGTTGVPKCIVHGAGGTLLQHFKELVLHSDLRRGDAISYFTTCGWMMWNWLVSSLFTGCAVLLYDGSPSYPDLMALWRIAEQEGVTHFGTSAKFLASCRGKIEPNELDLGRLRVLLSTGSPLLPEDFDWVYEHVKQVLQLSSISGGTDIISCFMLGNPILPVFRSEIQSFGLGMDVAALDETGRPVVGRKAELACRTPFPSMPVGFWNDPDGAKYRKAYFEKIPGVWVHGDFVEITGSQGRTGGIIVYGRSDATLNPGGVRIGTAEIYRLVETLPEVEDSIVVGQPWEGDVRVVLFVKLRSGDTLDEELRSRIRTAIRTGATPRHVPAVILAVEKIPYTVSGKKTELAVLQVIQGEQPANVEALADASALDCYRGLPELAHA